MGNGTDKAADGSQTEVGLETPGDSGETPGGDQETSAIIDEARSYSGTDVKKLILDDRATGGRAQKVRADAAEAELTQLRSVVAGLKTQVDSYATDREETIKRQEEDEREAVKDDLPALNSLRTRQTNRLESLRLGNLEKDLTARETVLTAKAEQDKKATGVLAIKAAASTAGVSEKALADLVPDGDAGRLATAADLLKKSGSEADRGAGTKDKPAGLSQRPVSAQRAPGTDASGLSSEDKIAVGLERKKKA